jgi:hypothetical protein
MRAPEQRDQGKSPLVAISAKALLAKAPLHVPSASSFHAIVGRQCSGAKPDDPSDTPLRADLPPRGTRMLNEIDILG